MTKAELIDRIAKSKNLPPDLTKKLIAEVLDIAFDELGAYFTRARITRNQTPRFTYPGFGTFTKKRRSPRKGVNPRTLEPMVIDGYDTLDFKPGAELKRTMNERAASRGQDRSGKDGRTKARAKAKSKSKTSAGRTGNGAKRKATSIAPKDKKSATKVGRSAQSAKSGRIASSPSGRRLTSREEAELALGPDELELPEAPMQRARKRTRGRQDGTG